VVKRLQLVLVRRVLSPFLMPLSTGTMVECCSHPACIFFFMAKDFLFLFLFVNLEDISVFPVMGVWKGFVLYQVDSSILHFVLYNQPFVHRTMGGFVLFCWGIACIVRNRMRMDIPLRGIRQIQKGI